MGINGNALYKVRFNALYTLLGLVRIKSKYMSKKIDLDKYYTNDGIVDHCLNVVDNLIIDYESPISLPLDRYLNLKIVTNVQTTK